MESVATRPRYARRHIALAPALAVLVTVTVAAILAATTTPFSGGSIDAAARLTSVPPLARITAQAQQESPPAGAQRLVIPGLTAQGRVLSASVSIPAIFQGGAARVSVPGAVSGTMTVFDRTYDLRPEDDGATGYFGIGVLHPPGPTNVVIEAVDAVGSATTIVKEVTILPTQWTVDYIVLPPGVGEGLSPEIIEAENNLLAETYARVTEPMYEDAWHSPVDKPDITGYPRVTGEFGEQRSFNGGPPSGHHGGTDFGAFEGTTVYATNHGTVVIARELAVRGNMVIVDHGGGILTGYAHLSSMDVVEGQTVGAGQQLGGVGTTGLSTGNHLHWEFAVFGILVDGLRWLDGSQGF